ncbi:TolC family protein [Mariniblastus sp.]|nr:TolC family protein [Mariniblastus sp.]
MRTTRIATLGILILISSGCQGMPGLKRHSRDSGVTHSARTPVSKWTARPSLESDEPKVSEASKVGLIRKVSFQEDVEDDEKVSLSEAEADDQKKLADELQDDEATELEFESSSIQPAYETTAVSINSTSLAEIEQLALSTNPAVAEVQAEIESLRGKLTQAGLPPNPTVGIVGSDINEDGNSGGRYGVYFGREIVRGNKLGYSRSVVCAEIRTAEQRLATVQQRLLTDVRKRYYDLLVAQETVAIADELVKISQNAVDVSEQLLKAKEAAQTSVLQSEVELQNAFVVLRQAENQRLAARRKLAGLLGEADLPSDYVDGNARDVSAVADFEQSFDDIVGSSPEIAALFADVEQKRRQLQREIVEPIPNVTWQATLQYDVFGDDVIPGFQIGMPLPTLNRNQGAIHQARYQIVAAERRAEKKALGLRQRLTSTYESYLDAKILIDAYDSEIIPKAKQTLDLVSKGYREGEIDFLQLLTAQRTYSQINLTYLRQLQQVWRQNIEIKGMLLSGSLEEN